VAVTSDDSGQVFAGAQRVELTSQDGEATASLVVLDDGSGIVTSSNLAPLPADRTYQLWAIDGGDVESAGVLGQTPELAPFTSGEGTGTFAITVEQAPGASAPTTDPVVSGAVA
jgi:anti-sigma-K factor RskA